MCGIAGIYSFASGQPIDGEVLDRMTDVLAHRGPDGRGTHVDGELGLGFRRLAIIDLSEAAAQPMANEDGSVWVVCNGEIYNFRDLRRELVGKGHRFRSHCDVEVLVHLYEEEGDRLVERLRGMFAFALWDARRRRLLLARDRFGQKPLYYRLTPDGLHFASEIKGILQDPEIGRQPELEAIDDYLTYGYVPSPRTAFAGINKLPAAHLLTVEANGRHRLASYWRLRMAPKRAVAGARERRLAERRLLELLDESTRLRLVSDVPLGALLSGGVDSSAVVASMCASHERGPGAVRTFALGFREAGFDESGYAARVASYLGTDHHTLVLAEDSFAGLECIAWHYGEPFADSSCLPTFAISGLARRHVTVALTGDGGDELFCGYRRHLAMQLEQWIRAAPAPLPAIARSRALSALLRHARRKALASDLERSRRLRDLELAEGYVARLETLSPGRKARLYAGEFEHLAFRNARRSLQELVADSDGVTIAERCAHADAQTYLPDDILTKVDVASMAHGLECRAPLLDHRLAEHVAGLPFELKIAGLERKAIFKRALAGRLPGWVLARRKKGFSVPLKSWFRDGTEALLRDTLLSSRAVERGYFVRAAVEGMLDEHLSGRRGHQASLFSLLMLELWHQEWIDPVAGQPLRLSPPLAAVVG